MAKKKTIKNPATGKLIKKTVDYKAILEMAGNKYKGEGQTLFEAMDAIKLDWQQIKAKGVMTITHGNKKVEKLFYLKQLKRIFINKITKIFWAKNLETLMKETAMNK